MSGVDRIPKRGGGPGGPAPEGRAVERPPMPPGIGPVASALMELQRTAGNSAVLGIVGGRGARPAARLGSAPPRRRLARRRTFSGLDLFSLLDDAAKSGDGALAAGFERWWRQAWAYINDLKTPAERARRHLPPADPGDVTYLALTGMKQADFLKAHPVKPFDAGDLATALGNAVEDFKRLPIDLRASKLVDALVAVYPELKITTTDVAGARVSSTKDKDNVKALATAAGKLFTAIASGSEDDSLREVFGDRNLAKAKKKYAAGEKMMNKLVKAGDVVVDRSGYRDESGIAGSSKPGGPIMLNPSTLDDPGAIDSVRTMLHESMHAGNADVGDKGYVSSPGFLTAREDLKLTNAAHFEVVPLRIIAKERGVGIKEAFAGQRFVPAAPAGTGTGSGGSAMEAGKKASDALEMAWNVAGMLHTAVYLTTYDTPALWDLAIGGVRHRDFVPFWSKVEKLTIHERLGRIDSTAPPGFHRAKAPVTEIDVALSEEIVRDLGDAMDAVPNTDADLAKLYAEAKLPDTVLRDRTSTIDKQRDLIIELVCGVRIGGITGTGARDLRAALALAETRRDWARIQKKRAPTEFAD